MRMAVARNLKIYACMYVCVCICVVLVTLVAGETGSPKSEDLCMHVCVCMYVCGVGKIFK
jgi:hypothetical protein